MATMPTKGARRSDGGRILRAVRRRVGVAALGTLLLALTLAAAAAGKTGYALKHPAHEHCRAGYTLAARYMRVHRHRVRQEWCVPLPRPGRGPSHGLPPPPTGHGTMTEVWVEEGGLFTTEHDRPSYILVRAGLGVRTMPGEVGEGLIGLPVTFTITDKATGAPLGSFSWRFNYYCHITLSVQGGEWSLNAQALIGPEYAREQQQTQTKDVPCPLPALTGQASDGVTITASFAGSEGHEPSSSEPRTLVN